jgi:hypothetical protein
VVAEAAAVVAADVTVGRAAAVADPTDAMAAAG